MDIFTIKERVHQTRKQFEAGLVNEELLSELYRGYKDVGDTLQFVRKAKSLFPRGNCGLASLYLKEDLGGEVVQGQYEGHNHTFLTVDDIVVDITADQFGGPKVYVGPLCPPWAFGRNNLGNGNQRQSR